ncbi:MAG: cache domain-containing protein, partial [Candidatus Cloacimonadota bacterium]|nr:cache domain-containing protein [Candidatus Cloacimonadota bacterium]
MTIKSKLIIGFLLIGIIPMVIIGFLSLNKAGGELLELQFQKNEAIVENKKLAVELLVHQWTVDIESQQTRSICTKAQKHYQTYLETGEKTPEFDRYDAIVKGFAEATGYYDYFIIDKRGMIIHSAFKESDYKTNILTGKYKSSGLAKAVKVAMNGDVGFADFAPYAPSNGDPAGFIAAPILIKGKIDGVVALQISMEKIQNVMMERTGMGETGEAYLVGDDKLMRSDSFIDPVNHSVLASFKNPSKGSVDTKAVSEAISGKHGQEIIDDYNGNPVLSSWNFIDLPGDVRWALIAEIDKTEADLPMTNLRNIILIIVVIIIIGILIFSFLFATSINKGIQKVITQINNIVDDIVNGKLDTRGDVDNIMIDFKEVAVGINSLIDAFVAPINMMAEYVDRISKGDPPPLITDDYKGDFNEVKSNLNGLIEVMTSLISETEVLIQSTKDGKLDTRGNADKFIGDWSTMVGGINELIDAILTPVNDALEAIANQAKGEFIPMEKTYNGDFEEIKQNVNAVTNTLISINGQFEELNEAASNGKLDFRGRPDEYKGAYKKIVEIVNSALDALINPLNMTAEYIDRISKGDIPPLITDEYYGDFNEIKNNVNGTINVMESLTETTQTLIDKVQSGVLDSEASSDQFIGSWKTLIDSINIMVQSFVGHLDAVKTPIMLIDRDMGITFMNKTGS